jgi:hypothetical protein
MTAPPPTIVVPYFDESDRRFNDDRLRVQDTHFAPRMLTNLVRSDA